MRRSLPLRSVLALLATLAVLVYLALSDGSELEDGGAPDDDAADNEGKLRIQWLSPLEPAPGAAVIVRLRNLADDPSPIEVRLSIADGDKYQAQVLHREGDRLVVKVPADVPLGPAKLRVSQGERRSKPVHVFLRGMPVRDVLRDLVGGLALLFFGLATVGSAMRSYASQRVRAVLARLTHGRLRSTLLGALVGGLTQSTTSSAGLLAGLLEARLLAVPTAIAMLLGAQLGAAIAGAVLPLVATRDALWIVALGVLWVAISDNRHTRAAANIVLGCGLLFLGLRLLHSGLRPLLSDPQLLPYMHVFDAGQPGGVALCVLAGALLCGLLQGPGPVFALVASLAGASNLVGLREGLAILAGSSLGAVLGTLAVSRSAGRDGAWLVRGHLAFGLVLCVVSVAGLPAFVYLADLLVAGDPSAVDYDARMLHPSMGVHLAAGFWLSQVAGAAVALAAFTAIVRVTERAKVGPKPSEPADLSGRDGLAQALERCRAALVELREVTKTRERGPAVSAERTLGEARTAIEALLREAVRVGPRAGQLGGAASGCLHLATSIDSALRVAERALELAFAIEPAEAQVLERLHGLLIEGVDALLAHLRTGAPLPLEEARAREIHLNSLEAEARRAPSLAREEDVAYRLWLSELLVAYEALGNQLYRLTATVAGDDE
jgi:hypothetical protein